MTEILGKQIIKRSERQEGKILFFAVGNYKAKLNTCNKNTCSLANSLAIMHSYSQHVHIHGLQNLRMFACVALNKQQESSTYSQGKNRTSQGFIQKQKSSFIYSTKKGSKRKTIICLFTMLYKIFVHLLVHFYLHFGCVPWSFCKHSDSSLWFMFSGLSIAA